MIYEILLTLWITQIKLQLLQAFAYRLKKVKVLNVTQPQNNRIILKSALHLFSALLIMNVHRTTKRTSKISCQGSIKKVKNQTQTVMTAFPVLVKVKILKIKLKMNQKDDQLIKNRNANNHCHFEWVSQMNSVTKRQMPKKVLSNGNVLAICLALNLSKNVQIICLVQILESKTMRHR